MTIAPTILGVSITSGSELGWRLLQMIAYDLPATLIFGAIGIALLLVGFIVFDKILPRIDFQVELGEKRNWPLALVISVFFFSLAWIITSLLRI